MVLLVVQAGGLPLASPEGGMIPNTLPVDVVGLPLAFVLATCSTSHAHRCRARVENGEIAREPVRAVVVANRWWVLVQFERAEAGEIMFPLDAFSVDNKVVGTDALNALASLRGVVAHEEALCARVAP
jgi:hypothetical protein